MTATNKVKQKKKIHKTRLKLKVLKHFLLQRTRIYIALKSLFCSCTSINHHKLQESLTHAKGQSNAGREERKIAKSKSPEMSF